MKTEQLRETSQAFESLRQFARKPQRAGGEVRDVQR